MRRNPRLLIFIVVFIDLLGFGLILPLLPFYAEQFGATASLTGLLVASYAAAQLAGSPVLGRLSDRYGRRPILVISIAGTSLGFVLLGLAEPLGRWLAGLFSAGAASEPAVNGITLALLFASRVLDGLTGGNISVAQAYITDVTDEKNRARGLGMIGAAFGLGFIIGPAVGGLLSGGERYAVPALAAGGLAFLNWLGVLFWLPESLTAERRAELARRPARSTLSLPEMVQALRRPIFGPLVHTRFWHGLAFATFTGVFALFAQYRLGLTSTQTGYVLAYVGLLAVLVQGVLIGRLTARFAENRLAFAAVAVLAVSLLGWALAPSVAALLIVLTPLSMANGVLNTVINSAISKSVRPEEIGGALGLSASVESLTRVIGPSMGGLAIDLMGTWAPGVIGALIMTWLATFVWRRLIAHPDPAPDWRRESGGPQTLETAADREEQPLPGGPAGD